MTNLEVRIRKPIELKAYVECLREISCDRCPNLVKCILEAVEGYVERNNRKANPEKEVVRY